MWLESLDIWHCLKIFQLNRVAMNFRIGTIRCKSVFIAGQLIQLTQFGIITKPCCQC